MALPTPAQAANATSTAKSTTTKAPSLVGGANPLTGNSTSSSSTTTPITTTTETSTKEVTNSKSTIFIAGGAALLLLCAIAYVIVRDARRVAPADEVDEELLDARLSQERVQALRKRRTKAKAARQQRKRNKQRAR
jgi:hypothetical protein